MATVMTSDRKMVLVDLVWLEANARFFGLVRASDGVWLPACDLQQYESGKRVFLN